MQGRLLPPLGDRIQGFPADRWEEEFGLARTAGLACIEWIYEDDNEHRNPLSSDAGLARMRALVQECGVGVWSICADWFMKHRLVNAGTAAAAAWDHLAWLIERARAVGATYIVLPFVDSSSLRSDQEVQVLVTSLRGVLPAAERAGVELHLETDLPPERFRALIDQVGHPLVRANFDSGNSASLGFEPAAELAILGPVLGSVHIKDRRLRGGTVPLGTGDADLPTCFRMLREVAFQRWLILQVARDAPGREVEWAVSNRQFVERAFAAAAPSLS
jgi:L-ribulose-5-phosphate 3-epimerase